MTERDPLLTGSQRDATPTFTVTPPTPDEDRLHEQESYEGSGGTYIVIKDKGRQRIWGHGRCFTFAFIWLVLIVGVIVLAVFFRLEDIDDSGDSVTTYSHAAVAADNGQCSKMGRDILQRGGSAVDGAITSLLCLGVINSESSGLGGGFIMQIYSSSNQAVETIVATERAPIHSSSAIYVDDPDLAVLGPLAASVPGELMGMWEAHKRYGRLPWKELFQPVINIAREGFPLSQHAEDAINMTYVETDQLKYCAGSGIEALYQNEDGSFKREGDIVTNRAMADTLQRIADNGVQEFYNGETAKNIVADLQNLGSIFTLEDLETYTTDTYDSPSIVFGNNLTLYTSTLPSLGDALLYQINVMEEYNIKQSDFTSLKNKILLYHRFIESIKFGLPAGLFLGHNMTTEGHRILSKLVSDSFAKQVVSAINDTYVTFPKLSDYTLLLTEEGLQFKPDDIAKASPETTHLSVVADNGDAVSVTSSVGNYFGSCTYSNSTGIFFNNHMSNYQFVDGLPNSLAPGERCITSRTPSIVTDEKGVNMVVGSSGGEKIIFHVAWVLLRTLLTEATLTEAIDERRLFANLDNNVDYEEKFPEDIVNGLKAMGHSFEQSTSFSVVQSILRTSGGYTAHSDPRKGGFPAGY